MATTELLQKMRALMQDKSHVQEPIHAYIVPNDDAHQSEYTADRDRRREFISKFDGSNGLAIITLKEALLWTDGRYFLQAEKQLDKNWTLMKAGTPGVPRSTEWLSKNLTSGNRVGVDPLLMSYETFVMYEDALKPHGIIMVGIADNLVDLVWTDRPPLPEGMIWPLPMKYTGKSCADKIADIREDMKGKDVGLLVLTSLDDIAWTLNLRGWDIPYTPVFFSYLLVSNDSVDLFVYKKKIDCGVLSHFNVEKLKVRLFSYDEIATKFKEIICAVKGKIWISESSGHALVSSVPSDRLETSINPVYIKKVNKNPVEAKNMISAHIKDGVAVCKFIAWLECEVPKGNVYEICAGEKLDCFRAEQEDFVSLSFENISASGPNASLIHYTSTPETNRKLSTNEMYLIDSGGQYKDGTTDITRTLHFGTPTDEEKEMYTRVLKGQIAIRTAIFPSGTQGYRFEAISRRYIWEVGYDYRHSLGHGVGMCLGVHELPAGIMGRPIPGDPGLQPDQFVSNEPGVYLDDKFGIRIEDVVQVVPIKVKGDFFGAGALTFKTITMVPLERRLIDIDILTSEEIKCIDDYHCEVLKVIGPILKEKGTREEHKWLCYATAPLSCS